MSSKTILRTCRKIPRHQTCREDRLAQLGEQQDGGPLHTTLLQALVYHQLRWNVIRREFLKGFRGDARREAVDIYDHIDRKELKRA